MINISPAKLSWNDNGLPYSLDYDDIYFSDSHALEESTYVFLEANRLTERWRSLKDKQFIVGECGFGGGLNFMNTCKRWCETAPANANLHYLACELHPFLPEDIQRLTLKFPELADYSSVLLEHYPALCSGIHQRKIKLGKHIVYLSLLFGDATTIFKQITQTHGFKVDAWFLDGFSPSRNPQLWHDGLCKTLATLSKQGTTLSTYSAAGTVKQALSNAGFKIERKAGFGRKRHMLFANYGPSDSDTSRIKPNSFSLPPASTADKHAIIIGAGLAGCSTAHALAESGWQVTVIEREPLIANKASGNKRGILACKLSNSPAASTEFYLHAYLFAEQHYRQLAHQHSIGWESRGLLHLTHDKREQERQAKVFKNSHAENFAKIVSAEQASELAGINLQHNALYFPKGVSLDPKALCEAYLQHPAITQVLNREALSLTYQTGCWHASDAQQFIVKAPVVVIANSYDAKAFQQSRHYCLLQNFGQIDEFSYANDNENPHCIVSGKAYLLPCSEKSMLLGGVTLADGYENISSIEGTKLNLDLLRHVNKRLAEQLSAKEPISSRQALRCSSPDYLPVVGPVENSLQCQEIYQALRRNAHKKIHAEPAFEPGLFINVAHGSNGLCYTPLSAAYLTALINGAPLPLSNRVAECLHPIRFLIRSLKRQELLPT